MKTYSPSPAFLAVTLLCGSSIAVEPELIPKNFSATMGGFRPTFAVELRDGTLYYTQSKSRPGQKPTEWETIKPTPEQWRELRKSLDQLNVWQWRPDYSNSLVADGIQWSLEIEYTDHALKTKGSNSYPDDSGAPKKKEKEKTTGGLGTHSTGF